ncbi:hypothetical protein B0H17DRAFT_1214391 [Mycena rosella]|uniref:Uncharacterized protein n=1 Tax=Mycena rosella TaxID=1033263 RepID=A0AAD7G0E9_MYCRO|nr:hypothetical protein B0H17DRAFT_1214391 [Mycena rosella]
MGVESPFPQLTKPNHPKLFFFKALLLALVPATLAVDHAFTIGLNNALSFTPDTVVADIGAPMKQIPADITYDQLLANAKAS